MKKYIKDYILLTILLSLFSIITGLGIPSLYDVNILPYYHNQSHLIYSMVAIMFLFTSFAIVILFCFTLSSLIKLYASQSDVENAQERIDIDDINEQRNVEMNTSMVINSLTSKRLLLLEKKMYKPLLLVSQLIPVYFLLLIILVVFKSALRY